MSNCCNPHGLQPTKLLCPWDFPGKTTGVGCRFLLQGILPTQGSNPCLLQCRHILYRLSHQGSPLCLLTRLIPEAAFEIFQCIPFTKGTFQSGWGIITCADLAISDRDRWTFVDAHHSCPSLVPGFRDRETQTPVLREMSLVQTFHPPG